MVTEHGERKLVAILAADVVGYSRLANADEEATLARLRTLRSELFDPSVSLHRGRVVKRTGDGALVEFRSVVDAVRCAIELQKGMVDRNRGIPPEQQIEFRIGIHVGDVVEENDGDLMGDGVNIAARLEGISGPGGISLSGAAYEQVRDKIKETFRDLGEKELKNIARPVKVFALGKPSDTPITTAATSLLTKQHRPPLSILVLPFVNIGGDPDQDYFVDGITESLTTDLSSSISGSFVIARNTAFAFKGKAVDVKQVGHELNIRYILEGSVQRGGDRLRINVQLIDAETATHLWADRFDKAFSDLFGMQDEIISRLANALDARLMAAEARRAETEVNVTSMDAYFRGRASMNKGITAEYVTEARGFFERAVWLDPNNVDARACLALVDATAAAALSTEDYVTRFATAEANSLRALSTAPNHALSHFALGIVNIFTKRVAQGLLNLERSLLLDRNLADAHTMIGMAKLLIGRSAETEGHVLVAFRLSPRDIFTFRWMATIGVSKLHLGEDEEAVTWLQRSIETNHNWPTAHFNLAAALALLGRLDESHSVAKIGLALEPHFTLRRMRATSLSDNPTYAECRERVFKGMLLAGIPEG